MHQRQSSLRRRSVGKDRPRPGIDHGQPLPPRQRPQGADATVRKNLRIVFFRPDYPRLFPSLDSDTDKYTLTAFATDAKGNTTQKSIQFAYYPKNLVTLEKLKTLGVVKALKTSDNTPLAVMRTGQLRRNDGSLAQGVQTANITLRKDADYAINILGNVIQPGETKEIQIDLGNGENSTVPIFTAEDGSTGESNFIIEFPQIQ